MRFSTAGAKPSLVLGDDDRPVEPGSGVVGRIVTGGRLPLGYHGDPEKTAATFLTYEGERWLITGDLATVAEDGTVELLGRGSVSINTGGEKVHPEEVEGVLHGHPSVADVLVVGVPDERWGSAVTAVVQPTPGTTPTLDELVAHCKQQLSGLQGPEAPRARRAGGAQPGGQGRLPLGGTDGRDRRDHRLISACAPPPARAAAPRADTGGGTPPRASRGSPPGWRRRS